MRDLTSPPWMRVKAALFLILGVTSCGLILWDEPSRQVALLLALTIWSFCRAYYFVFYVIEKYIDPSYRFSGLVSALRYLFKRPRSGG